MRNFCNSTQILRWNVLFSGKIYKGWKILHDRRSRRSWQISSLFVKRGLLVEKTDHFHRRCVPLPKGKSAKWARIRKLCFFHFQENIIQTYPRFWPRNQETENHDFSLLQRETLASILIQPSKWGLFLIIVLNKLQMIHSKTLIGFCCTAIRWLYFLEKICVRISCKGRKLEFISFSIPPRVLGGKDTSCWRVWDLRVFLFFMFFLI